MSIGDVGTPVFFSVIQPEYRFRSALSASAGSGAPAPELTSLQICSMISS
jgi:hypothetical protein